MNTNSIKHWLSLEMSEYWLKINQLSIDELSKSFNQWALLHQKPDAANEEEWTLHQLVHFLLHSIEEKFDQIQQIELALKEFKERIHTATNANDYRNFLVELMTQLNYKPRVRKNARKGKLEWLEDNALYDKATIMITTIEQSIVLILERITALVEKALTDRTYQQQIEFWRSIKLSERLLLPLRYPAHEGINTQAFRCLRRGIALINELSSALVSPSIVQYIFRLSIDESKNVWLRSEAIGLICQVIPSQIGLVTDKLFTQKGTDIFLKARTAQSIIRYLKTDRTTFFHLIQNDHSEYVRQCFAEYLEEANYDEAFPILVQMMSDDLSSKVKVQAILSLCKLTQPDRLVTHLSLFLDELKSNNNEFVIRSLCHVIPKLTVQMIPDENTTRDLLDKIFELLALKIESESNNVAVTRWLNRCREAVWAGQAMPFTNSKWEQLLKTLPFQKSLTIPNDDFSDPNIALRYLCYLSNNRFGFDISQRKKHWLITSGFKFKIKLWRFLYELLNTATDKRQNHSHIKGRQYHGQFYTASPKMAEQSRTKVPGEPYLIESEQGHRSYLPLPDQMISILEIAKSNESYFIYTAEGITEIIPPQSLIKKLRAYWMLNIHFDATSELRDWEEGDSKSPSEYLQKFVTLGFQFKIHAYGDEITKHQRISSNVSRFFPSVALPITLPTAEGAENYFYSVYNNTVMQLLVFVTVLIASFITRHCFAIFSMKRWRRKIPLVIGGWGSRGKSGTERLKAALFNSLGVSVLSKTTGCEAMFLYGAPNRPMKELFLFRPYDKATIWEQVFLTKLSGKMNVSVFLWECMGLTPRYIDILQNQWMQDDLSTITNCYPDHEDIQGPAGIEIPIVMQRFITRNGHVFTTEDSMFPLLADAAHAKKAMLSKVSWLDIGLISEEVINRFPYAEHPNNIALVMKLAESLGLRKDYALKAMADHVVADLGVLKIYPIASVANRQIQFINGMSANERFGALSNWKRTGLANLTIANAPSNWTAIVINNRADRIARSKVFASILVNDAHADRYFLIGNNLAGFQSYVNDAWSAFLDTLEPPHDLNQRKNWYRSLAQRFRIAVEASELTNRYLAAMFQLALSEQQAQAIQHLIMTESSEKPTEKLNVMLQSYDISEQTQCSIKEIFSFWLEDHLEHRQLLQFIQDESEQNNNYQSFIVWLKQQFIRRFVVVQDYYSTGNQTINIMVKNTPPGLLAKIMGMQNIKGTGLDFVYRFQAWDQVHRNCEILVSSNDAVQLSRASKALLAWEEYGLLDELRVTNAISAAAERRETQQEVLQAEFNAILKRVETQMRAIRQNLTANQQESIWLTRALSFIEAFLDSGDAVKRRKKANRIYKALLDNVISFDKASVELAKLTKAQKGGWLMERYKKKI